jgi:O-antigen/teichoic acid export membrane protein
LGTFFSNYVLGIFGWVSRSFYAPMTLIANSVGRTFNQRISDRLHDSLPVKSLFYKVTGTMLMLTILPSIVMGYFGEEIYGFVFGETWSEAGTYLLYLLPWYILSFTYSPIAFLPIALGAQKSMLHFEIFSVITRTSFLILGGYFQSIQFALSGYSISGAIIILFMFLYIFNLINKYEHSITSKV